MNIKHIIFIFVMIVAGILMPSISAGLFFMGLGVGAFFAVILSDL